MAEHLTYYAALQILGKPRNRVVSLLDVVATAGLTVWAASALAAGRDAQPAVSLLEIKNEVVRYGHEIVRRVSEWRSGLARFDRSQRLAAAHAVLVVASYFEALDRADLPVPVDRLALSREDLAVLAKAGKGLPRGYVDMIELLLREPFPMPEPHRSYADVQKQLAGCYEGMSNRLMDFVSGLVLWKQLTEQERLRMKQTFSRLPVKALERYNDGYRRMATDNHEFEVWAGLTETHALGNALSGMSFLLSSMTARQPGQRSRAQLRRSYQTALNEPIIKSDDAPEGVVFPSLAEAYVNPICRIAEIGPNDTPAVAEWWVSRNLVPDIETFLTGYLTSPRAVITPLVVLGGPGSGKSKFTEVLAARLSMDDFLPVLVELRDVAAESMIQEQIEQAIYRGPGERVYWHDLVEAADGALPVVLLDGFDELVQATAVNRYDYLEQVRDFQARQAQIGHPVAVIVTTRTVVADQVRFPLGSVALQLQPFNEDQVRYWLEVWDRHNASGLATRGLRSLPAGVALAHGELAEQPLLLLMLAIFDASGNVLQHAEMRLGRTELYERLLTEFALREVAKSAHNRSLPTPRQEDLAQLELHRLAAVALAMFARGRQAATDAELNRDLPLLLLADEDTGNLDVTLTPAQRAVGRFFFVHKSQARWRDERTRSYEFLHATFGEFLVARLTLGALRDLAAHRKIVRQGMAVGGLLDDGFLYAVLSFSCLAVRAPIIDFLRELLTVLPEIERTEYGEMIPELITSSLTAHPNRSFQEYEPVRHTVPRRLGVYSANLVILLVLLGGKVSAKNFSGGADAGKIWPQYGYLWRSSLTSDEWLGLIDTIRARVSYPDGSVDIILSDQDESPVSITSSLAITERSTGLTDFDIRLSPFKTVSYDAEFAYASHAGRLLREIAFTPNWQVGMLLIQSVPALRALGDEIRLEASDGTLFLPGHLLAYLEYDYEISRDERLGIYEFCLENIARPAARDQVLIELSRDVPYLAPRALLGLLGSKVPPSVSTPYLKILNELWWRLDIEGQNTIIKLVSELRERYPKNPLAALDPHLRALGAT